MKTVVVNLHKTAYDVYIGRAGRGQDGYFGNPFVVGRNGIQRGQAVAMYRAYFINRIEKDPEFRRRVLELKGKKLGCFCKPASCHGDVIAEWLDSQT